MKARLSRFMMLAILFLVILLLVGCRSGDNNAENRLIGIWKEQESGDLLILMENHTGLYRTIDSETDLVWDIKGEELNYTIWEGTLRKAVKMNVSIKKDTLTLTDKKNYADYTYKKVDDAPVPGEPIWVHKSMYLNPNGCIIKCRFSDDDDISIFPPSIIADFTLYSDDIIVFQGKAIATKDDCNDYLIDLWNSYRCVSFFIPADEILCDVEDVTSIDSLITVSDDTINIHKGIQTGPYLLSSEFSAESISVDYWSEIDGDLSVIVHTLLEFENDGVTYFVIDSAKLLTREQLMDLNNRATHLTEKYCIDVRIFTLEDSAFEDYNIEDYTELCFDGFKFGYGTEQSCIMLFLNMENRDYYIMSHGYGNEVFTDSVKEELTERFLTKLGNNDWFGGFSDYLDACEKYLNQAA